LGVAVDTWLDAISDVARDVLAGWGAKAMLSLMLTLIGAWRIGYTALMVLMVLDLILGVWRAAKAGELSARIARVKSLSKLGLYWAIIIAAYQLEVIARSSGGLFEASGNYSVNVTILYLGLTEFLSVLRSISAISGKPINPFRGLPELLKELKGEEGAKDEGTVADKKGKGQG